MQKQGKNLDLSEGRIYIKSGREKSLLRRHPWVFPSAIHSISGDTLNGGEVKVLTESGVFLGWGTYSEHSQIRVRVWSWVEKARINQQLIRNRLESAISLRKRLPSLKETDAMRLVFGESDGLPGLIVDRYGEWVIVQFLHIGVEQWRSEIIAILIEICSPKGIFERSDVDVRILDGLEEKKGLVWGELPPDRIIISEEKNKFFVNIHSGHKTGFYLDQRSNRSNLARLAPGCDVLDCFCYGGGFSMNALRGGARSVTGVDASAEALALARENLMLNHLSDRDYSQIEGDVFRVLRSLRDQGKSYDLIILDPPKFAPTVAQVERAARGYKDINRLAFKLLRIGGKLVTFSCSGGVDPRLFQKIVADAALDAGVNAQIISWLHQDEDHPVGLSFPEAEYLKGLIALKNE